MLEPRTGIGPTLSAIMICQGIPQKKTVATISTVLNMTSTQAHRKLKGESSWEVEQLLMVLSHLNFPAKAFFSLVCDGITEIHDGMFNNILPCKIYLTQKQIKSDYSAFRINNEWFVYHQKDIPGNIFEKINSNINVAWVELVPAHLPIIQPNPKIAIMDDDFVICETLKQLLSDDYNILTFNSIHTIKQAISETNIDGIILDWITPEGSSYRLIDEIRKSQNPNIPIIIMTGKGAEVDIEISKAIDNFDIIGPLQKPVRTEVLRSQLNRIFHSS